VIGPDQKFLTRVKSGHFCSAQVGSSTSGFGKSPKNLNVFQFFSLHVKKISSGGVKKYVGQRRVDPLFIVGQKYARAGSGPISSLRIKITSFSSM